MKGAMMMNAAATTALRFGIVGLLFRLLLPMSLVWRVL
jgi:hypothetical protein